MKQAYTLVEVLVVIAIMSVIAAISYPLIAAAKLSASETSITNALRQTGLAIQIYREEAGAKVEFGPAVAMGMPPTLNSLELPPELYQVRGNHVGGGFTQQWEPGDDGASGIDSPFTRYVRKYESQSVVVYCDLVQRGAMPKSLSWSIWQISGLNLGGGVQRYSKIGYPVRHIWFHED